MVQFFLRLAMQFSEHFTFHIDKNGPGLAGHICCAFLRFADDHVIDILKICSQSNPSQQIKYLNHRKYNVLQLNVNDFLLISRTRADLLTRRQEHCEIPKSMITEKMPVTSASFKFSLIVTIYNY